MKIGVFSDVHDKIDHMQLAMDQMHILGCGHFIFLGDCCTPACFRKMVEFSRDLPLDAVPGNNDYNTEALRDIANRSTAARVHSAHALITRHGIKLSLSHYPKYALQEARLGSVDVALYGHTHETYRAMEGDCLIANPGEIQGRFGKIGFGILDTERLTINLHAIELY